VAAGPVAPPVAPPMAPPRALLRLRASALHERAKVRQLLGDDARAIADFSAALALTPGAATALLRRALSRRACGDVAGAADDAERARRLRPDDARFRVNYATLHEVRAIVLCAAGEEDEVPLVVE